MRWDAVDIHTSWYLVCSCSVARCQQGSWCFQGSNGCSRPELGTHWGFQCVWVPAQVGELRTGDKHRGRSSEQSSGAWVTEQDLTTKQWCDAT